MKTESMKFRDAQRQDDDEEPDYEIDVVSREPRTTIEKRRRHYDERYERYHTMDDDMLDVVLDFDDLGDGPGTAGT